MNKIGLCRLCLLFAFVPMLFACSEPNGDGKDYLGKWSNLKNASSTLVIEKKGDEFVVHENAADPMFGKITTTDTPATMKEGTLQTQTAFAAVPYVIDKTTGNLFVGRSEYKRVK